MSPGGANNLGGGNLALPLVVNGDVAAISDWQQNGFIPTVDIWRWTGSSWTHEQELVPTIDPMDSSYFGRVIDLDGDTLVVGDQFAKRGDDNTVLADGQVYVYEFDGSFGM